MRVNPTQIKMELLSLEREKASLEAKREEATQKEALLRREEEILRELRARDREVRAHEEAHLIAAGPYAKSGPRYETVRGPDGREYAIAGEVSIDTSPVPGDPEETLKKARAVKRAALAPAHPSAQDLRVAMKADHLAQEALMEILKERTSSQISSKEALGKYRQFSNSPDSVSPNLRLRV